MIGKQCSQQSVLFPSTGICIDKICHNFSVKLLSLSLVRYFPKAKRGMAIPLWCTIDTVVYNLSNMHAALGNAPFESLYQEMIKLLKSKLCIQSNRMCSSFHGTTSTHTNLTASSRVANLHVRGLPSNSIDSRQEHS